MTETFDWSCELEALQRVAAKVQRQLPSFDRDKFPIDELVNEAVVHLLKRRCFESTPSQSLRLRIAKAVMWYFVYAQIVPVSVPKHPRFRQRAMKEGLSRTAIDHAEMTEPENPALSANPEEALALIVQWKQQLAQMPPNPRRYWLMVLQGYEAQDIAARYQQTVNAVCSALWRNRLRPRRVAKR